MKASFLSEHAEHSTVERIHHAATTQHMYHTMINSRALLLINFLIQIAAKLSRACFMWKDFRHWVRGRKKRSEEKKAQRNDRKGEIMKQIATIFSKQPLTAPTNHRTNCIWIKGSPSAQPPAPSSFAMENNIGERIEHLSPNVCMNKYFIVFLHRIHCFFSPLFFAT